MKKNNWADKLPAQNIGKNKLKLKKAKRNDYKSKLKFDETETNIK